MACDKKVILTVDINHRNQELLSHYLGNAGFQTTGVASLEELDRILEAPPDSQPIDLALVDVSGFDRRIWTRCQELSARGVPLLVVSPKQSMAIRSEGLKHGARSVLVKPLVIKELLGLIKCLVEG